MSVVVRMEMPKCCLDCPCVNGEYGYCQADKEERQIEDPNGRPSWCPIICSLPEGHGDLVDWGDIENELDRTFRVIVDDGPCAGSYIREYPQSLIEQPIRVRIIVPADTAERSDT